MPEPTELPDDPMEAMNAIHGLLIEIRDAQASNEERLNALEDAATSPESSEEQGSSELALNAKKVAFEPEPAAAGTVGAMSAQEFFRGMQQAVAAGNQATAAAGGAPVQSDGPSQESDKKSGSGIDMTLKGDAFIAQFKSEDDYLELADRLGKNTFEAQLEFNAFRARQKSA